MITLLLYRFVFVFKNCSLPDQKNEFSTPSLPLTFMGNGESDFFPVFPDSSKAKNEKKLLLIF